ncbi:MAG: hypothetical protein ABIJ12_13735 [bacterium]
MVAKRICVVANSIKKSNRCIAGREILKKQDGIDYWGNWIRPVSSHDEGAVSINECRLQDNCVPSPFDLIQVDCQSCENDPSQPENWLIQSDAKWQKLGSYDIGVIDDIVEAPDDLWLEPFGRQDRVSPTFLTTLDNHQSLYLIKPDNFNFFIESSWSGGKRVRGVFVYNGTRYDFSMTDPIASKKYCPNLAQQDFGPIYLNNPDNCYLCISITPEFKGYHYKIVSTVIEAVS